jgi:hypothetical protein
MPFNFEENKTVADLSTVPEQFRSLYVEATDDGNTVHKLSDAVAGLVEAYTGTNKALESARSDKKKASDESAARRVALKAIDDFVVELGLEESDNPVETLRSHFGTLSESVKNGKEIQIDLDKIRREYEVRMAEKDETHAKEIQAKDGALERHLVQDVATRALTEAKGAVDLLLPHVRNHCKVVVTDTGSYEVRVVDAQGDVRSDGAGGWMGVNELVAELKSTEMYGRAFDSETPGGGGSPPGGMNRVIKTPNNEEKSSISKISDGLTKGQRSYGAGAMS